MLSKMIINLGEKEMNVLAINLSDSDLGKF